jgi:hypothetical protein
MHFCYVWLRRLVGREWQGFDRDSTRSAHELTGNATMERGLEHFTEGLAAVFRNMARALKRGAPLVFTFHHNQQAAYAAAGVAMLDAGLTCSASLPCPAEMGGSIHIHGTGSSIVDTVFVCRATGTTRRRWLFDDAKGLAAIVTADLHDLETAGLRPSTGDFRCLVYGHLTRMAVWRLRGHWKRSNSTDFKLHEFASAMDNLGRLPHVTAFVEKARSLPKRRMGISESLARYEPRLNDAVSF